MNTLAPRHHLDRCLFELRLVRPHLPHLVRQWDALPANARRSVARTVGLQVLDVQGACGGAWSPTYAQTRTVVAAMARAWLEELLAEGADLGGVP